MKMASMVAPQTLSTLREKKRLHDEKAHELEAQLDAFKSKMSEAKNDELEVQLSSFRKQLQEKDTKIGVLEQKLQDKANKIEELVSQMAAIGEHLDKSYHETLECLQAGSLQAEEEKKELARKVSEMEFLLSETKRVAENAQKNAYQVEQQKRLTLSKAEEEIAQLEGRLSASSILTDFLQNSLNQCEDEKRMVNAQNQELKGQVGGLSTEIRDKNNRIAELERACLEQSSKIVAFEKQMTTMQDRFKQDHAGETQNLHASISRAQQENRLLVGKIEEMDVRLATARAETASTRKEVSRLEDQLRIRESNFKELEDRLTTLQGELLDKDNAIKVSNISLKEQQSTIQELQQKIHTMGSRLMEADCGVEAMKIAAAETIKTKEAQISLLENQLFDLNSQLQKKEHAAETNIKLVEGQASRLEVLLYEKEESKSRAEKLRKDMIAAQSELAQCQEEKRLSDEKRKEVESKLNSIHESLVNAVDDPAPEIKALEGRLVILEKQSEVLKADLLLMEELKQTAEAKVAELQAELDSLKMVRKVEEDLIKALELDGEQKLDANDLRRMVAELEFRLTEANRAAENTERRASQLEEEKQMIKADVERLESLVAASKKEAEDLQDALCGIQDDNKLKVLETQLSVVQLSIREKDNLIEAREKEIREQVAKMHELFGKIANLEDQLAESDKVTKFAQSCTSRLEGEKQEKESNLQTQIADLELRLAEAAAKIVALQETLCKTDDEKSFAQTKVESLEDKIRSLSDAIAAGEKAIEVRDRKLQENSMKLTEMSRIILELEGRLSVSNQVTEFLQRRLSDADDENRVNESKWQENINKMKLLVAETNRVSGLAVSRAEKEKIAAEAKARELICNVEKSVRQFYEESVPTELENDSEVCTVDSMVSSGEKQELLVTSIIPLLVCAALVTVPLLLNPKIAYASQGQVDDLTWQNLTPSLTLHTALLGRTNVTNESLEQGPQRRIDTKSRSTGPTMPSLTKVSDILLEASFPIIHLAKTPMN